MKNWEDKLIEKYQKKLKFQLFLKTLLNFTITFLLFISLFLTLHYVPIKALIWFWGLYGSNIFMTNQLVWCKSFLASFQETTCSFLIKQFFIWFICEIFVLLTLIYSYIFESVHLFQRYFNCWALTLVRLESKHTFW